MIFVKFEEKLTFKTLHLNNRIEELEESISQLKLDNDTIKNDTKLELKLQDKIIDRLK